jgi:hypothetical protein
MTALACIVQEFLAANKMKIKLEVRRLDRVEEIQAETQRVVKTLTNEHFQDAFQK